MIINIGDPVNMTILRVIYSILNCLSISPIEHSSSNVVVIAEIPVSIQRQPSYRQSQKNQLAGPESFPQRQSNVLLLDNLQPVQRLRLRLQSAPNGPPILFEEAKAKTHWDTFKAFLTRIFGSSCVLLLKTTRF